MSNYDVIVIGGGASGMMAAGRAAECGKRVLLVEKNKVLGKKLSITGGGRCNILNAEKDVKKLLANYGDAAKFLHSPFSQHGMQDSWDFFHKLNLPLVTEARKRSFPQTQDARDVTRVMREYCLQGNVEFKVGVKVTSFLMEDDPESESGKKIIGIETNKGKFLGESFILSTGGSSHTETGSTGEGVEWLRSLGHMVHTPNPNIVPLKVVEKWVKDLSGTTLSFMKITFTDHNDSKNVAFSRTGKILFTHFGLSGPLILNAAREVKSIMRHGTCFAYIDMYPDTEVGTLRNRVLEVFNNNKNKELGNVLKEFVPHGMSDGVAAQLTPELLKERVHSVSKEDRYTLVDRLKAMPLTVNGTMGMDWAVVSDGGVDLSEVDTKTMGSKLYKNLHFTGDVLHINRPSGGYSLQLCWTSGWVAGQHA